MKHRWVSGCALTLLSGIPLVLEGALNEVQVQAHLLDVGDIYMHLDEPAFSMGAYVKMFQEQTFATSPIGQHLSSVASAVQSYEQQVSESAGYFFQEACMAADGSFFPGGIRQVAEELLPTLEIAVQVPAELLGEPLVQADAKTPFRETLLQTLHNLPRRMLATASRRDPHMASTCEDSMETTRLFQKELAMEAKHCLSFLFAQAAWYSRYGPGKPWLMNAVTHIRFRHDLGLRHEHILATLVNHTAQRYQHGHEMVQVLEIGVNEGAHATAMLAASPGVRYVGLDSFPAPCGLWSCTPGMMSSEKRYATALRAIAPFEARAKIVRMNIADASSLIEDGSVDVVVHNGGLANGQLHRQDNVEEMRMLIKKLKPGGTVAGYDYGRSADRAAAVEDLFAESGPKDRTLHLAPEWVWFWRVSPEVCFARQASTFADAALWAWNAIPPKCFYPDAGCRWVWLPTTVRYAWNNFRLAVKAAHSDHVKELMEGISDALVEIHEYIDGMGDDLKQWETTWPQVAPNAYQVVEMMRDWLSSATYRAGSACMSWGAGLQQGSAIGSTGQSAIALSSGVQMPTLGLGVWQLDANDGSAYNSVMMALAAGYRHIDTAQGYGNEREVGRAVRDSGVPRSEIFIVTKLSRPHEYAAGVRRCFLEQLDALGMEYVDVYMLHSPGPDADARRAAWRELEALYAEGRIRGLGVSNFNAELLTELLSAAHVRPVYLQNKFSVYHPAGEGDLSIPAVQPRGGSSLLDMLTSNNITLVGYSAINPRSGSYLSPLDDPHVNAVAQRVGRPASQVLHRWLLQLGVAVIPRSSKRERIVENAQVFDFELSEADMHLLSGLASLAASTPRLRSLAWGKDIYGLGQF